MYVSTVSQFFLADLNAGAAGLYLGRRCFQYVLILGFAHPPKCRFSGAYMHPHKWYI
nr:hypothetical protein [Paucibacter sp. M5-1]MCZ7881910.1 hypothetical protein [Paucibacter sp. M5-1]